MSEMRDVPVRETAAMQLEILAAAWGTSVPEVVDRLLAAFRSGAAGIRHPDRSGAVQVHAIYQGNRVTARFHPATSRTEITSGPLEGRSFRSPSGAAIAVVEYFNPLVQPNRNGWTFWTVDQTAESLQALRREPTKRA